MPFAGRRALKKLEQPVYIHISSPICCRPFRGRRLLSVKIPTLLYALPSTDRNPYSRFYKDSSPHGVLLGASMLVWRKHRSLSGWHDATRSWAGNWPRLIVPLK